MEVNPRIQVEHTVTEQVRLMQQQFIYIEINQLPVTYYLPMKMHVYIFNFFLVEHHLQF